MRGVSIKSGVLSVTALVSLAALAAVGDAVGSVGTVRLRGYLGERLDALIRRQVEETDVDYITAPFLEKTERGELWQSEFWGKWMHSAVPYLAYADSPRQRERIRRGVARILASQEPCGYIGNYPDELRCGEGWDVWGIKYTMMGLMHYYDGTRSRPEAERREGDAALQACRRLCDYVIAEIGPGGKRGRALWETGNWSGYASSSVLEPVIWLYRRTNDRKYLDFAAYIVAGMTEPEAGPRLVDLALKGVSVADRNGYGNPPDKRGGYVCKHNRWKAYEMMSCYQGLLEYYQLTGRADVFEAALKTAEDIVREEVNLAGGCSSSEAWIHGATVQHLPYKFLQETCVTITWMRLCEKLLEVTDDPLWADQMERTFYNAYLAALRPDGSEFASYSPLGGSRWHGMNHCFMHTDCCSANGPRGFLSFLRSFYRRAGDTATFNFYGSAQVDGFDMYSHYPRQDAVRITSHRTGPLALRLRIPAWSVRTVVRLNGRELAGVKPGSYFVLSRTWALGDVIEVTFDMPVVAHTLDRHVAFTRGPVLLARDSRFNDGDMAEPLQAGIRDGQIQNMFFAVRVPSDAFRATYSAVLPFAGHRENPEGRHPAAAMFCDYASAGDLWTRDNCYRTWFPLERGPGERLVDALEAGRLVLHAGNRARLEGVFARAERGERIVIGALGGSITEGAGSKGGVRWSDLAAEWFRARFPKAEIVVRNAGIGATGSMIGALRFGRDLGGEPLDVVFLDFTVNDRGKPSCTETYEGCVRQILENAGHPAAVLVGFCDSEKNCRQGEHLKVARHYDLPFLSIRDCLAPALDAGRVKWSAWSEDNVHPNVEGHAAVGALVSGWLDNALEVWREGRPASAYALPETRLTGTAYENGRIFAPDALTKKSCTGFVSGVAGHRWKGALIASKPGDAVTFEVEGPVITLVYWRQSGDYGRVRVKVDGRETAVLEGWFDKTWGGYAEAATVWNGAGGSHRVELEVLDEKAAASEGHRFELCAVGVSGER